MPRKVLLADDSVTAQNMGRRILVDAGYEVITVNNGSSALKKVNESKPDLIVLDVYMPGYGGLEVCQRIRESSETARIPVLLTVGKLEPFKAEEAHRVRADAFIVKPFEASELLTAVTKLEDKIVPQPANRKSGRTANTFADEEAGVSKAFGDVESGWKNRLKIPPPHQPRPHATASRPDSDVAGVIPSKESASFELPRDSVSDSLQAATSTESMAVIASKDDLRNAENTSANAEALPEPVRTEAPEVTAVVSHDKDKKEERNSHEEEVAAALASLAPSNSDAGFEAAPVTIAAAIAGQQYSGPRWIAQEVGLSDDESSLILEQEMQKAFAAFAAADAARTSLPPALVESHSEGCAQEQLQATIASAGATVEFANAASETSVALDATAASPIEADVQKTTQTAAYAAAAGVGSTAAASEAGAEAVPHGGVAPEVPAGESTHDSELASSWASWKQVRDSVSSPEFTSQVADAAATGYKEIRDQQPATAPELESAAAPAEDSGAIASIVDSVLAELKPKLMEEIAKKMKKPK